MSLSEFDQRKWVAGLYDEAVSAMEHGGWHDALAKLEQVREFDPEFPGVSWRQQELLNRLQIDQRYLTARQLMYAERWLQATLLLAHVRREAGDYAISDVLLSISERYRNRAYFDWPNPLWWIVAAQRRPAMAGSSFGLAVALGVMLCAVAVPFEAGNLPVVAQFEPGTPAPTAFAAVPPTENPTQTSSVVTVEPTSDILQPTSVFEQSTAQPSALPPADSTATVEAAEPTTSPDEAVTQAPPARPPATRPTLIASTQRTPTRRPTPARPSATPTAGVLDVATLTLPAPAPTRTPTRPVSTVARPVFVSATEFQFEPSNLIFVAGERVRLTLTNNGSVTHDWVLLDGSGQPWVKITAAPGASAFQTFTVPPPGIYNIQCDIGDHAQQGMTGKATVR